jgi:hypothetical protein
MRIRIFKGDGGLFRVVLEPRRLSGLRKRIETGVKKEELASVILPAAQEDDEILLARKRERRERLRP